MLCYWRIRVSKTKIGQINVKANRYEVEFEGLKWPVWRRRFEEDLRRQLVRESEESSIVRASNASTNSINERLVGIAALKELCSRV